MDLAEGHTGVGIDQLLKLHKENPSNAEVVTRLAELALQAKNFKDASDWEEKLLKLLSENKWI